MDLKIILLEDIFQKRLGLDARLSTFDQKSGFYVEFYLYLQILRSVSLCGGQNIKKIVFQKVTVLIREWG